MNEMERFPGFPDIQKGASEDSWAESQVGWHGVSLARGEVTAAEESGWMAGLAETQRYPFITER
jgi:hypothetical protein